MRWAIGALALAACASAPETRPSSAPGCVQVAYRRKAAPAYSLGGEPIAERALTAELARDGNAGHEARAAREWLNGASGSLWAGGGLFFTGLAMALASGARPALEGTAIGVASVGLSLAAVSLPLDIVGRNHLRRSIAQYNQAAGCGSP
jgi:hypothetical protein